MTRFVETINPDITCCYYCGGNAGMDAHAKDCPMVTDVWTVGLREIAEEFCCVDCSHEFELGEHYTGRDVRCLGCAARTAGET